MAEYIERADAASFFENSKQTMWHKDDIAATISSKKNIPAADVVEVKHGEWIEKQIPLNWCEDDVEVVYRCSICDSPNWGETPYCPMCSAKMDGERRKEDA